MKISRRRFAKFVGASAALPALLRRAALAEAADPAFDPLRPEFHLMPPHNWMNDPNGPIWWKGKYHLFYQLNPSAAVWGDMHWGHAVSTDMIHWQHQPVALAPTPGGADSEGCFSGSAVVHEGVPTFIYTGVQNAPPAQATIRDGSDKLRETQMIATAEDDDLLHWKKREQPVIAVPPASVKVTGFRDPCPWREDDGWYLGVGSGERGKGGCVLLYRSQDLRSWEYLHKLAEGKPNGKQATNPCDSGEMWECPDFFVLGKRYCLFYSTEGKVTWTTGRYDERAHRYTSDREGVLDHGAYYAPKSFQAPDGRRILWGWVQEKRPESEFAAAGWSGAMSLPRVLEVDAAGKLMMMPAAEVESLRGARVASTQKQPGTWRWPLEALRCELSLRAEAPATVRLRTRGTVVWELHLEPATGEVKCGEQSFTADTPARSLPTRIFLDGSVIETFFGTSDVLTSRVYTVASGETDLEVEMGVDAVEPAVWALAAISPNRLTH
jgi:beta-fructofuranosidase